MWFCVLFASSGTINDRVKSHTQLVLSYISLFVLFCQMNAQKQKGQALNAASAQKAIDILKVR
jgi:protein TIF31